MKKILLFAIAVVTLNSCHNDDVSADSSFAIKASGADYTTASALPVQTVSGDITANTTWTNDRVWEIDGVVRVKGAMLTIQPGTFIKAKPLAAGVATGVLVITKTGTINAQGTECSPIVFTSYKLLDSNAATKAEAGDFGGVVVLGDAVVNNLSTTNIIEGLGDQPNVSDFYYGGTNNSHDAGDLKYIRIEFAGRVLDAATGVEINGLTFGGVGSGTFVDYIQVSYGKDDSFEFFGGTVSASHLVSFAPDDDNFDFDLGFTGSINRALSVANKNSTHSGLPTPGTADSNGIELDNDAAGSANTPITRPRIDYMSIYGVSACADGALYENGVHVRRNGDLVFRNSLVAGYSTGMRVESGSSAITVASAPVNVNAFTAATAGTGTFGTGIISTASCTAADKFGITQPFYTPGECSLDLAVATARDNGAFATGDTNWTSCWTKFCDFVAIYE